MTMPLSTVSKSLFLLTTSILILQFSTYHLSIAADQEPVATDASPSKESDDTNETRQPVYVSPEIKLNSQDLFLYEHFDDESQFNSNWIPSSDPKYSGQAKLSEASDRPQSDKQLLLPDKARHYGLSSKLQKPFKFSSDLAKPLVVQYEVQFRDGLDCGGAYIKLIRESALNDLTKLDDKTPFTIMFGPDKCGSDSKLHFIVQYPNPRYEEKHWKKAKFATPLTIFSDKQSHLFKLVLEPDNTFELFIDDDSIGKGNLLEDLEPEINPPKEIVDPNDTKPADWDERAQIDDPDAKKPDDWNEDLPKTIDDPNAEKPSDWLDTEPKYIPDPDAKKPEDWEDMDGDWEAPLIENPACTSVSGCGDWQPPKIANPDFKGKWKAPRIDNPNYKGKWSARVIPNPDYFYDQNPFSSLDSIGAVAFELWTMAENIAFDNLIITGDKAQADYVKQATWNDKRPQPEAGKSYTEIASELASRKPYLMLIPIGLLLATIYLISKVFFASSKKNDDAIARKKKQDESRPDDRLEEEPEAEEAEADELDAPEVVDENEQLSDEEEVAVDEEAEDEEAEESEADDANEDASEKETESPGATTRRRASRKSATQK